MLEFTGGVKYNKKMTKPKKQSPSRYIKSGEIKKDGSYDDLKKRAKEFLNSETPASYTTQIALALLIVSGVVFIGAVAPGVSILARGFRRSKKYSDKQIADAIYGLKRSGYLSEGLDEAGKPRVFLTKNGEQYFQKILFEDVHLPEPKKWGGKWTFVLFDLPIEHKKAREALRWRLKALGFYQYQKSVWVYPHPCEKEILYVADYFGVGKFVEILSVDYLSNEKDLRKHFKMT